MSRLNITSILSRMTLEQDDDMQQLVTQLSNGKKTAGNPIAIRFKPAVRTFITQVCERLGISSAELVNILIEGVMRETLEPRQATITRIPERFWLLMDEHGLSVSDVASLLANWNIGLSILESRARTMDYLTGPLLTQLADGFCVNPEWLKGSAVNPAPPTGFSDWYHAAELLKNRITETFSNNGKPDTAVFFLREYSAPNAGNKQTNAYVGICITRYKLLNNVPVRVVEYLGRQSVVKDKKNQFIGFMSLCGILFGENILRDTDSVSVPPHLMNLLHHGEILPISAINKIQRLYIDSPQHSYDHQWSLEEQHPLLYPEEFITSDWKYIAIEISNSVKVKK